MPAASFQKWTISIFFSILFENVRNERKFLRKWLYQFLNKLNDSVGCCVWAVLCSLNNVEILRVRLWKSIDNAKDTEWKKVLCTLWNSNEVQFAVHTHTHIHRLLLTVIYQLNMNIFIFSVQFNFRWKMWSASALLENIIVDFVGNINIIRSV